MALFLSLRPFRGLPDEILYHILEMLDTEAYITFVITHYVFFFRHGLAPPMNTTRLANILDGSRTTLRFPMMVLPPEILLEVMQRMPRQDMMSFGIANYRYLADVGIAPQLTDGIVESFLLACPL